MRSALAADLDCEQSLEAMRHAFRASKFARRNYVEIDAGVVHALLNARYYESARGQFLSQDPTFQAVGTPKLTEILNRVNTDKGPYYNGWQSGQKMNDLQALQRFLSDPQLMNSYGYARDNPIVNKD